MGKGSKRKRGNSGWSDRPKKENGAGEYPPAHTYESAAFDEYYRAQGLVPPAEWDEFKAALKRPLGIAFRILYRHSSECFCLAPPRNIDRHPGQFTV